MAYGDARGIALVPEFEMPGHSGAARRCMPEVFSAVHPQSGKPVDIGVMNLANEALYPALDTLIGEMCDVFRSSPYFHIGTDECETNAMAAHAGYKAFLARHGLKDEAEVTRRFIREVNAMVARRGKKTIKWEGIADDACDDVVCMCWVGDNRTAERMVARGFTVITCPWNLGLPWPEWSMYFCNGSRLTRNDPVLGSNVVFWEQTPERHLCGARRALAERQERTWGPDNRFTEDGFARRWNGADSLAARLIGLNTPKAPAVATSSLPGEGLAELELSRSDKDNRWQWLGRHRAVRASIEAARRDVTVRPRVRLPLLVRGHSSQRQIDLHVLRLQVAGQRLQRSVEHLLDGSGQFMPVSASPRTLGGAAMDSDRHRNRPRRDRDAARISLVPTSAPHSPDSRPTTGTNSARWHGKHSRTSHAERTFGRMDRQHRYIMIFAGPASLPCTGRCVGTSDSGSSSSCRFAAKVARPLPQDKRHGANCLIASAAAARTFSSNRLA